MRTVKSSPYDHQLLPPFPSNRKLLFRGGSMWITRSGSIQVATDHQQFLFTEPLCVALG